MRYTNRRSRPCCGSDEKSFGSATREAYDAVTVAALISLTPTPVHLSERQDQKLCLVGDRTYHDKLDAGLERAQRHRDPLVPPIRVEAGAGPWRDEEDVEEEKDHLHG